ncbi:sulfurtransferase TusA family protein [Psychrobacter sp. I-STPA6b]|uniref:sulfurtransferase TusA family protein n=1 Tax=Psychrobacter sp. I-STPA6b TaxID=2585718 RepID=UPI001D0C87CA|nr:sulfurtransferase TusA family protein [Psychrobacter sp. I-STPA6b]
MSLSAHTAPTDAQPWLAKLPTEITETLTAPIETFIDGRNLACPMPLLKTKVGLRTVNMGNMLYLLATDPNSQTDIQAFCRQSNLPLYQYTTPNDTTEGFVYHFFILKSQ